MSANNEKKDCTHNDNDTLVSETTKLLASLGTDYKQSNDVDPSFPDLTALGLSKKMQKKLKHLPPHLKEQLANMPDMPKEQLEQNSSLKGIMGVGKRIAQQAINQNVKNPEDIQQFLTSSKNQDEIIQSGKKVMESAQNNDITCLNCDKLIMGRKVSCLRCETTYYCNGKCRKADYRRHRKIDCHI